MRRQQNLRTAHLCPASVQGVQPNAHHQRARALADRDGHAALAVGFWYDADGTPERCTGRLATTAAWSYANGRLTLPLKDLIESSALGQLASASEFGFFFTLKNKLGTVVEGSSAPCDANPQPAKFSVSIETKQALGQNTAAACEGQLAGQRFGTGTTACSQTLSIKDLTQFASTHPWYASMTKRGTSQLADQPLYVDPVTITTKSIGQDSPYPCDVNVISVTIKANKAMPFLCKPCITVSGLSGSLSENDSGMLLSGTDAHRFGSTASWLKTGSLSMCATSDLGTNSMTFSFKIVNPEMSTQRDRPISLSASMTKFYPTTSSTCLSSSLGMDECTGLAPAHVYKHDSTCHEALKECWPLNVRGLVLEVKRIGQSTPHPGCTNTISVTLRTNVPLVVSDLCQTKLTIAGFTGAEMIEAGSTKLALTAQPGQCDVGALSAFLFRSEVDQLSGFGEWKSSGKQIELYSAQRSQAGQQYIFSFQVQNPTSSQAAPNSIKIQSLKTPGDGRKGIPSHTTSYDKTGGAELENEDDMCFTPTMSSSHQQSVDMSLSEEEPCCLCDVDKGDAKPMRVKAPSFCVKRICHTSHWPCANNTITVTISPTREVAAGQVVTITGLAGASVVQSDGTVVSAGPIELQDLHSGGNEHHLHFAQSASGDRGFGAWNANAGELKLYVADALECSGQYIVSFTVKNAKDKQDCRAISIRVNGVIPATNGWEIMSYDECHECPMMVADPAFSEFHVTQSSATPCCQNTISVSLKANVPMWKDRGCPVALTVAGLTGACKPAAGLVSIQEGCAGTSSEFLESSLHWTPATGTVQIVLAKEIPEHQEVCFSFTVTNPATPVSSDISKVRLTGDGLVFVTPKIATTSSVKAMMPITVFAASFDVYQIGQSSPWLCQSNKITVLLRSNQPLLDSCNPMVTISGITGFDTKDTTKLPITDEHTQLVTNHPWVKSAGTVTMKLKDLTSGSTSQDCLGETCHAKNFRFSFELLNPKECSKENTIKVEAHMTDTCGNIRRLTGSAAGGRSMMHLDEPVGFKNYTCESKYDEVTFGPRPWYLADNLKIDDALTYVDTTAGQVLTDEQKASRKTKLTTLASKMTFDQCKPPFKRSAKSMSFGGASMQFPSHTNESYTAAVRMGAGALSCQIAFTRDTTPASVQTRAVCRDAVCDLAHTTDILAHATLRNKCTYLQGSHPVCCVTSLTADEYDNLVAILPTFGDSSAATIDQYAASVQRTEAWRTTVYQDGACFKPMFVRDFIKFAQTNNVTMLPELLDGDYSMITSADTPAEAAQLLAAAFNGVDSQYVFPQSTNVEHVKSWLSSASAYTLTNAVYRFHEAGDHTWNSTYAHHFEELLALENPIRYASTGLQELLQTAEWGIGGDLQASEVTTFFQEHCIGIFAGTLESWTFYSRSPRPHGLDGANVQTQLGATLHENKDWAKLYLNATKDVASSEDLERVMRKDADIILLLDALFEVVKVQGVYSEWPSTVSHYINCVQMPDRYTDGTNLVDFGPRPWYLADNLLDRSTAFAGTESAYLASSSTARTLKLKELQGKLSWNTCPGPHKRNMESMALGGAAMEFPRNSKEAFVAAARMGAGALGCEATFSKDGHLVCREQVCDLHYTTDILLKDSTLAAKCTSPFAAGNGAKCCTTDFTKDELATLCSTMNMATQASATTAAEFLMLSNDGWRTTIYQDGICSPVMSHTDFIALAQSLNVKIVSELKHGDYSAVTPAADAAGTTPSSDGRTVSNKNDAADAFLADYVTAGFAGADLYPQSMDKDHVKRFLSKPNGANAVFRYGPGLKDGFDTWSNTYKAIFDELRAETPPLKFASVAMNELLIADDKYGGSYTKTEPATYFHTHGINIFVWTFDAWKAGSRTCYASGSVDERWRWYHGQCLSAGQFYAGECAASSSDGQCEWMVYKDADELLILHALFTDAQAMAVFSEWPATVSHYTSCVKQRPETFVRRPDEVGFVRANDAYVGFTRCNTLIVKHVRQTSLDYAAAPCATVTIHVKLGTSVPLWAACSTGIRLAGLTGSCTDLAHYNEASDHFALATTNSFNMDTGLLRLDVVADTKAGCEYDISFNLTHSAMTSTGVVPTIQVLGIPIPTQNTNVPATPEKPMRVDALSFTMYKIWQNSSLPCDRNVISVTLETDKTNFLEACHTRVTITGLASSLSTPSMGEIDLTTHWRWTTNNAEDGAEVVGKFSSAGVLVVKLPNGPSNNWKMHFELDNPKTAAVCPTKRLKISMQSCLSNEMQTWPSSPSAGAELLTYAATLPDFGVDKVMNNVITRSSEDLCPLFIRTSDILTKEIGQSSPYPCDVNVLTVTLKVKLPMIDRPEYPTECKPCVTITGLRGSQTDDDVALALRSDYPLSSTAIWTRNTGKLELTVESGSIFVAGHDYTFNFTVVNQARAQCAVSPSIQTCMDASESMVTDGTTVLDKQGAQAGDARPFTILRSYFMTKNIGQTVPYPGCSNTIIVTVSFNLPAFPAHCDSFIRISGLQESSSYSYMLPPLDGPLQLSGEMHRSAKSWSPGFCDSNETIDSLFFRNEPAGTSGFATWENTKSGSNPQCRRLTAYFAKVTNPGEEYVFQFQVTNPVGKTVSPSIYLEGKMQDKNQDQTSFQYFDDAKPSTSSSLTSPHCTPYSCNEANSDTCSETQGCKHVMNKDSSTVLCCSQCSYAGQAVAAASTGRSSSASDGQMTLQGDAEPFKVHTPFFCVKKIGQSSCYPCDSNTLTVTLTSNAGMKAGGTTVTITNLKNANWQSGNISLLDGPNKLGSHMSFSSSFAGARGEALWDDVSKTLTLFVVRDVECTAEIQFSFVLENHHCEQDAQAVSIQASNVGNVPNVVLSGVNIAGTAMVHDTTTRGTDHWELAAVRGFAEGDAAPLKVCKLEIQSATVEDTSDHPCDSNQIKITNFRTNVPIQKTTFCSPSITVSGLTNAIKTNGVLSLDDLADVTGVTEIGTQFAASADATDRSQGTWFNGCNDKRATFAVRATINSHVDKGGSPHMFGFTLNNPARSQSAVAISLTVSGCGDAKTTGTLCTAPSLQMGSIMRVEEAAMDTRLQQTSSFPCDDNTITRGTCVSNVKVLSACQWKVQQSPAFQDVHGQWTGAITPRPSPAMKHGPDVTKRRPMDLFHGAWWGFPESPLIDKSSSLSPLGSTSTQV